MPMGDDDVASEISASIRDSITHTEDMDNLVVEEMTPARDSGVVLIDDQSSTSEFCESQFTHEEFRPLTQTSGVSELKYREISPEKPPSEPIAEPIVEKQVEELNPEMLIEQHPVE